MNEYDPYAELRERLIIELRAEGIGDSRVLEIMGRVRRHLFVPEHLRYRAYENKALPIGEGQTISQPFIVALMTGALELRGWEKVLEIGTGSGYQTAILAELAAEVYTVERSDSLSGRARENLAPLGHGSITFRVGDGSAGLPEHAPFDSICVTAASPELPAPLEEQLAMFGRVVIPIGGRQHQVLRCLTRTKAGLEARSLCDVAFVPLIGAHGWRDPADYG